MDRGASYTFRPDAGEPALDALIERLFLHWWLVPLFVAALLFNVSLGIRFGTRLGGGANGRRCRAGGHGPFLKWIVVGLGLVAAVTAACRMAWWAWRVNHDLEARFGFEVLRLRAKVAFVHWIGFVPVAGLGLAAAAYTTHAVLRSRTSRGIPPPPLSVASSRTYRNATNAARLDGDPCERRVAASLTRYGCRRLHDVYLPWDVGRVARIEHVALVGDTVVVIETKELGGRVVEADTSRPVHARSGERSEVGDPFLLNEGHLRAVRRAVPGARVVGLIVFVGSDAVGLPQGAIRLDDLEARLDDMANQSPTEVGTITTWNRLRRAAAAVDRARR